MKKSKLLKSFSALALVEIMAFLGVLSVNAEETQVTDKPIFDGIYEN